MGTNVSIGVIIAWVVLAMAGVSVGQTLRGTEHVQVEDVSVMMSDMGPVVLLKALNRVVPIFVDPTVAGSIDGVLRGKKFERPLSHDLMHTILQEYGGRVTQVKIRLKGRIYYGELEVAFNGNRKVFDSRSSDAIALAIHFDAPIYVEKNLLEQTNKEERAAEGVQLL